MTKKKLYYAFPTQALHNYHHFEIPCYDPDYVGKKTMLKYVVAGYFTQTDYAIAIVARLTFLSRPEGWELVGWKAYIGAWDVCTYDDAIMLSAKHGNQISYEFAKVFFDFPSSLYNNNW